MGLPDDRHTCRIEGKKSARATIRDVQLFREICMIFWRFPKLLSYFHRYSPYRLQGVPHDHM